MSSLLHSFATWLISITGMWSPACQNPDTICQSVHVHAQHLNYGRRWAKPFKWIIVLVQVYMHGSGTDLLNSMSNSTIIGVSVSPFINFFLCSSCTCLYMGIDGIHNWQISQGFLFTRYAQRCYTGHWQHTRQLMKLLPLMDVLTWLTTKWFHDWIWW